MQIKTIRQALRRYRNEEKAKVLRRFFKTGKGEYAEGDIFLGVTVPALRKLSRQFKDIEIDSAIGLLKSPIHEERLLALLIFILKYRSSDQKGKEKIYKIYLGSTKYINNWDLVDVTAKHIVGDYLWDRDRKILYDLAKSDLLWDRRIAILSTFHFIEKGEFTDALKISKILLNDRHDLIHKAVGWMLREIGKRSIGVEEGFLKKYHTMMPRTMLRYAIEKFPENKRQKYLNRVK